MRKSRVIKIVFSLTLTVAILLCSSVFVSAYFPIVNIESDEWRIDSEDAFSFEYPKHENAYATDDSCYDYSELNGYTYYGTRYWVDDYPYLTESDITIPVFPDVQYFNNGYVLLYSNNVFFLYCIQDVEALYFCLDSDGGVVCYAPSVECSMLTYTLEYPYTDWCSYGRSDFYDFRPVSIVYGLEYTPFDVIWSSVPVYRYNSKSDFNKVIHKSDNYDIQGTSYTVEYESPLSVLTGALSYKLSTTELKFLSAGPVCVRIDDFGMIAGTYTTFAYSYYALNIYDSDDVLQFSQNFTSDIIYDVPIEVGESNIDDLIWIKDYGFSEFDLGDSYYIELVFCFISDGHNLFFPGTFEIIEFESYEDDMEHDEVLNAIDNASSSITGSIYSSADSVSSSISSASAALSKEIIEASSDISSSINTNFNELMHGDTGYAEPSFDTSVIDSVSSNTDSTLDDIFSTLDNKILANLPSGYSSFEMYLQDNVDTLNTRFSYSFLAVRNLFDRFVGVTDITILILFSLVFGFAMYVLGRRLNHD